MTRRRRQFPDLGLSRFSGIYLWIIFLIVFGVWAPGTFLTMSTLHSVASQQAVIGIIAIAALVPLVAGQFDLSVGGNANLAGITAVLLQTEAHWSVVPSIAIGIMVGFGVGVLNSFVVVALGVSSFIATLGMGSILSAVLVIVSNSQQPLPPTSTAWSDFTQHMVGGFQSIVFYLLAIAIVAWWFLQHTPMGRRFYAVGGNSDAARLSGVRVNRVTVASLLISGTIAGVGGVLFTSLSGPSLTFGPTVLLPAFAAAFLGATQLYSNRFNVWGTLIAIYVLATGVAGLQLVSGAEWLNDMFNGVALILAVALAVGQERRNARVRRRDRRFGLTRPATRPSGARLRQANSSPEAESSPNVAASSDTV